MKLTYANEQADKVLSDVDSLLTVTLELLKDKDFSLEDRWALYLKIEHLLPVDIFISDAFSVLTDSPYDDFYMERHEQKLNSRIDEILHENFDPESPDEGPWGESWARMWAKRDEWREAVLAEGVGGFTFDW